MTTATHHHRASSSSSSSRRRRSARLPLLERLFLLALVAVAATATTDLLAAGTTSSAVVDAFSTATSSSSSATTTSHNHLGSSKLWRPSSSGRAAPGGRRGRRNLLGEAPSPRSDAGDDEDDETVVVSSFDDAVRNRYACTRYERYDGNYDDDDDSGLKTASPSDPRVSELAREALELSHRAPTGFNVQPYKLLLVESVEAKEDLSRWCIGRNRDRVLDSDLSVVFLADRHAASSKSWKSYRNLLETQDRNRSKNRMSWLKLRALTALFSGGIPLPKIIAGPIGFGIRLAMRVCSWILRSRLVVPTLSGPECWSQKNTMLVAGTYLMGCSSRGLDTTPMEGYLSWGVRRSLGIPRRYTIPLIVSTGRAYRATTTTGNDVEDDDAGMSHGTTPDRATPRFPIDEVVVENRFR